MDDVDLVYNTNGDWMRSGNPETSEDPISLLGNIVSREAICYNVGYIYKYYFAKSWDYQNGSDEDLEFKFTASHEIGHTRKTGKILHPSIQKLEKLILCLI